MRVVLVVAILASSLPGLHGCGPGDRGGNSNVDAQVDAPPPPPDSCVGLQCQVAPCEKMGQPATSISGIVHAPNGELPLFGVTVYVPGSDPGPLPAGVQCSQCDDNPPGGAIARAVTDELGRFTIQNAPSGTDIPLVVTTGKWRRQYVIPQVTSCTDNPVPAAATRLPKNKTEGDIPKIAIATGGCDALECLLRKLGIEDSEFTADTGTGSIHMYAGGGGANKFMDNTSFGTATSLWGSLDKLKTYDIGLFSCECSEQPNTKPVATMANIKAYADAGGRLFMSHYQYVWIDGASAQQAPPEWPSIAACDASGFAAGDGTIDEVNNPKGPSFALWMQYVTSAPFPGTIPIQESRQSCTSIDPAKAERWVYFNNNGTQFPQTFQFTTPNEMPANARCGKVVFSDMHVASGSTSSPSRPFPGGCSSDPMTPQEKALAFMFFDIASCVGVIQ